MKLRWLLIIFALISMIVSPIFAVEEPPALEERVEPPPLEESADMGTELQKKIKELMLVIPLGLQERIEAKGWVAWRMISYKLKRNDEPISYIVQYLTVEDNDRYFEGEVFRGHMLRAEAVFCHKHRRLSHFRWWQDGHWRVVKLHNKNGVT